MASCWIGARVRRLEGRLLQRVRGGLRGAGELRRE